MFNPMDFFSPFAPTTLDRDFKPGDDLIRVDHLFEEGDDLQAVAVFRRDDEGRRTSAAGSYGVKWHRLMAAGSCPVFLTLITDQWNRRRY